MVWSWVISQFEQLDVLRVKYEKWRRERDNGRVLEVDRRASLQALLDAATNERNNLMELAGKSSDAGMQSRYHLLAEQANMQVKGYMEDLAEAEASLASAAQMEQQVEDIILNRQFALEHLGNANYDSKRALLYAFDVQVKLWKRDHLNERGEPDGIEVSWMLDGEERVWHRLAVSAAQGDLWSGQRIVTQSSERPRRFLGT
jgi:hypothetical protein